MSETATTKPGTIVWRDLTVQNADQVRDFYSEVVGWRPETHDMGEYNDYSMLPADGGEAIAGICHARGTNANVPPQWLIYVSVADVAASARRCVELGGKVLDGPRPMGHSTFCVIQDPAGAMMALIDG
jgi:predicted enzyme related to lactoylglutathione lyase